MNWEQLCKLGLELPEVEEGIWFRTPALKVRGKSFVRLKEDGANVVFLTDSVEEQEMLIEARPEIYFITDHYVGWPAVLARLSKLPAAECRLRLERAWRIKAPKKLREAAPVGGKVGAKVGAGTAKSRSARTSARRRSRSRSTPAKKR